MHYFGNVLVSCILCVLNNVAAGPDTIASGNPWRRFVVGLEKREAQVAGATKEDKPMSPTITVNTTSPQSQPFGGPVAVRFTIANGSAEAIDILLPYPNPNNLAFRCETPNFAEPKIVEREEVERTAPITILAGSLYTRTYYLGRYFKFKAPGKAIFNFELRMPFWSENRPETSNEELFKGSFEVQLAPVSGDQLRNELATIATHLQDKDRTRKLEAGEALAFVESPQVVAHLLMMLRVDGLEVAGIHALALHRSAETDRAITSALGNRDSAVVAAALEEIDRLKIGVPRANVQKLLMSDNPGIQWLALEWLSRKPDRQDLPMLIPLAQGGKEGIREKASEYMRKLDALK